MSTSTYLPSHASTPHTSHSSSSYDYSAPPREPYPAASSSSSPYRPTPSSSAAQATSPTPSTSSSVASTSSTSRSSPMFSSDPSVAPSAAGPARGRTLGGPNSLSGGGGDGARTPRSQDGSVGSLATTVSSGERSPDAKAGQDTVMADRSREDGSERALREEARRDIEALSVRDEGEDEEGNEGRSRSASGESLAPPPSAGESDRPAGGKTRRASTLSSASSSATAQTPAVGGGEGEPSRSGRRKAARMGSFYGQDCADEAPEGQPGADEPPKVQPNTAPTQQHVDIVSYPSADLLRLLAALLEQIAQKNDERNAKNAAAINASAGPASSSHPPPAPSSSSSSAPPPAPGPSSRRSSVDQDWASGRFDAAPLNTPVGTGTPRYKRRLGGSGGPGILDNALAEDEEGLGDEDDEDEGDDSMPVTPGVDLLRETGDRGGVEGFMPSLGGTHRPQPLSRRRGSSFIRNKRNEDGTVPVLSRRTTQQAVPPAGTAGSLSSSGTSTPARPPPAPLGSNPSSTLGSSSFTAVQSGSATSSEPPLTSLLTASAVALSSPSATLCFHARNIPAISIEAYLQRILKYCPTTNEVFLALLVYFDRMARIGLEARRMGLPRGGGRTDEQGQGDGGQAGRDSNTANSGMFAIDSFNIHRLVIAGVTVASKFFSDVFYTNSRYAKVGGLPLAELNQLELQFLLLNDFRLKIPTDELQRYADQLILYWVGRGGRANPAAAAAAASLVASRSAAAQAPSPPPPPPAAAPVQTSADNPTRPRSIRSHPSSSTNTSYSSSVSSSTVTPGTPSTTRTAGSGSRSSSRAGRWDSDSDDDEGEERDGKGSGSRAASRSRTRGEDGGAGVAMQMD
ncbi:hypothetical protein JCM8097_006283 [Rhodosporidiobolus ruineniae]